jgi:hypothetical protein
MPVSTRTRFEIFKRDNFTCRYCGHTSPDVVLEIDHVVPVCEGGTDDAINLVTSCWSCNRGKAGVPLSVVMTGEDPHDKAIAVLEAARQLREYDVVAKRDLEARSVLATELADFWCDLAMVVRVPRREHTWIINTLKWCPATVIQEAMMEAQSRGKTGGLRYVMAMIRNRREASTEGGA